MNKTKIIVVEDNIVYCEYVCNMLSREGYRNMKAYHLSTAKKHLQNRQQIMISWLPTCVCLTAVA